MVVMMMMMMAVAVVTVFLCSSAWNDVVSDCSSAAASVSDA